MLSFTLKKEERICRRTELDRLFSGRGNSVATFPIRAVFLAGERAGERSCVKIMFSVPKRCFKRAVKRNRVKRQLREAYRHLKHSLTETMRSTDKTLLVAFVWTDNKLYPSAEVNKRMEKLLCRLTDVAATLCADA